jgi:hypothetical protein
MIFKHRNGMVRSLIFSILALLLIGAGEPPKGGGTGNQAEAQKQIAESLSKISGAINLIIPEDSAKIPCGPDDYRSNDDLCAQWKAADSAKDSACYAFWAMILGAIGTGLLIWTFLETRKTSQREQRAYLKIGVKGTPRHDLLAKNSATFTVENYGSTPALKVKLFTTWFIDDIPLEADVTIETWDNVGDGSIIHPQQPRDFGVHIELTADQITQVLELQDTNNLYVAAKIEYRDVFGKPHVEQACFVIRYTEEAKKVNEPSPAYVQNANRLNSST